MLIPEDTRWTRISAPSASARSMPLASAVSHWSVSPNQGWPLISTISIWHNLPLRFLLLYAGHARDPEPPSTRLPKIDGAGPLQTFWLITLPMMMSSILVGAVLFRLSSHFCLFSEVWLLTKGGTGQALRRFSRSIRDQAGFRFGDFGVAAATGWIMVAGSLPSPPSICAGATRTVSGNT